MVVKKHGMKFVIGNEAQKAKEQLLGNLAVRAALKGLAVYAGRVRGTAFVAKRASDLKKMNRGDIVVAHMTTVDFFPYIGKFSAIVTDEGGLTCHAAIISREQKIPCLVGTRFATQVIKTGDLIEVDTKRGIVRTLK